VDLAALADLHLSSAAGDHVRVGDLWATRPRILVFLRHFG
jgi:hypothetical protein